MMKKKKRYFLFFNNNFSSSSNKENFSLHQTRLILRSSQNGKRFSYQMTIIYLYLKWKLEICGKLKCSICHHLPCPICTNLNYTCIYTLHSIVAKKKKIVRIIYKFNGVMMVILLDTYKIISH